MSKNLKIIPVIWLLGAFFLPLLSCEGGLEDSLDEIKNFVEQDDVNELPEDFNEEDTQDIAVELMNARDFESALEILDVLERYPDHDERWVSYARAHIDYALGNFDSALRILNEIDPGPYEYTKLELRSLTYKAMSYYDEAYRDAEAVLVTRPWYPAGMHLRWSLDIKIGKFDRAREIEEIIDSVESERGVDTQLLLALFDRKIYERDFDTAEELLDRIPGLPSTIADETSSFYHPGLQLTRARLAIGRRESERAARILTEISLQYPDYTVNWPLLTWLGVTLGWYDRAEMWAMEGIIRCGGGDGKNILSELDMEIPASLENIQPASGPMRRDEIGDLLVNLAHIELTKGNLTQTESIIEKAVEINPYEQESWFIASLMHEINGDAEAAFDSAVDGLIESQWDYGLATRYLELAERYPSEISANDPDIDFITSDFLEMARGFNEMFPDDPNGQYRYANLLRITDDPGSIEYFRQAYETWPENVEYTYAYAAALAESDDPGTAVEILSSLETIENLPWNTEIRIRAAETGSPELSQLFGWLKNNE